jgi:putative transposase
MAQWLSGGRYCTYSNPETVLKWRRELVRRKWAVYAARGRGGRPHTKREVTAFILRFVQENADWGYGKLKGELRKLSYCLSKKTIANILARHGIMPAPQRRTSLSWKHLMQHYKAQIVACDFFTVETLLLKTMYALFFIELGSRRVHVAGCTTQPTSAWLTQQARQIAWNLEGHIPAVRLLIHDRDTKFSTAFDTVFQAMNIHIHRTPVCAPNANAFAERWVCAVRQECLNKLIVINEAHLRSILREYVAYYNTARPHQGFDQQSPLLYAPDVTGKVHRRAILGGIINDYYRAA